MSDLLIHDPIALVATTIDSIAQQDIIHADSNAQFDWLRSMGRALSSVQTLEEFSQASEGKILYYVWKNWDSLYAKAKSSWDNNFYNWAFSFSRKRASREPARITIDNKISVYRDWESDEKTIEHPETVCVTKRDECGRPTDEVVEIKFFPEKIDYSKKLVARGAARDGILTEEAWSVLADPYCTVDDLKEEIRIAKEKKARKTDSITSDDDEKSDIVKRSNLDFRFFRQNDLLYVGMNGTVFAFARLLSENNDSPLVNRAINHMLTAIGISTTTIEEPIDIQMPLAHVVDDGVLISRGCERIGHFSREEAKAILTVLQNWLGDNTDDF